MSFSTQRLYELLPALYRIRDAKEGVPLFELLDVIAREITVLEENLEQLYDDQFIETCAEWVVPYIGDLVGYRGLHGVAPGVASPRAEVANTIGYRRRKGTAAMLEQLARDVTGWPARAVEFFERLATTQYMNHIRRYAPATANLRAGEKLLFHHTVFDEFAHTVDVRPITSGAGRYNIPNIGIFLWRVRAFRLTRSPAVPAPLDATGRRFRFNSLGADLQLFGRPETEEEIAHLAEPNNVPLPLGYRFLASHVYDYYGSGKSVLLELAGANPDDPPQAIPTSKVRVCNLCDVMDSGGTVIGWAHEDKPAPDEVAIDPVLGRIVFGTAPDSTVLTSFHYGFTIAIGGGEYERGATINELTPVRNVSGGAALQLGLDAVGQGGAVEIADSNRYAQTPVLRAASGQHASLRAANGTRPLLAASDNVRLDIAADGKFTIDGVVLSGGALTLDEFDDKEPRHIVLRHCTLVPGQQLEANGTATTPDAPSLIVAHPFATVEIERCILGRVQAVDGAKVTIRESIVDAGQASGVAFCGLTNPASDQALIIHNYLSGLTDIQTETAPGGTLIIENTTVIGKVHTRLLKLASNTLFIAKLAPSGEVWKAPLWADRRQEGCVRFSYVPRGSLTPRCFHCQPAGANDAHVQPHFTSLRYGDPGYCQLRLATSDAIRQGADDESEIGVMHQLFQPKRETNVRMRLEEYLRFGLEAGIFYVT